MTAVASTELGSHAAAMTTKVGEIRNLSQPLQAESALPPLDPITIRAVLFDLDGTLYRQPPMRALMALELATLPLARPWSARQRLRALRAYRHAQEHLRGQDGTGLARRQFEAAAGASGLPIAEVQTLVADWMIQRPLKYLQFCRAAGLDRWLGALEQNKMRMGVLSDYAAEDKLRALGLEGRFSPVLCSTDETIDAFKPSPRGYLRACEIWGLAPSEVLFVGDRAEVDAAGAAAAGMPCAIIGSTAAPAGASYSVFPSFERLSRVFDGR